MTNTSEARSPSRSFWLAVALLLPLSLPGAGTRAAPPPRKPASNTPVQSVGKSFVGRLEGAPKDTLIGVVVVNNRVLAYPCGRQDAFNRRFARWLRGTLRQNGTFLAAGAGMRVEGTVTAGAATGRLTAGGKQMSFTARRATSKAGVFTVTGRTRDGKAVHGITLSNGDELQTGFVLGLLKTVGLTLAKEAFQFVVRKGVPFLKATLPNVAKALTGVNVANADNFATIFDQGGEGQPPADEPADQ